MTYKGHVAVIKATSGLLVLVGLVFAGIAALDARYAAAADLADLSVTVYYGQYYDNLDRIVHAESANQTSFATELKRRNEHLKAAICAVEPEWERCRTSAAVKP